MNSRALVITGVAALIGIATFGILTWRAPYVEPVERLKPGISADKVFSSDVSSTPAAPAPVAAAAPALEQGPESVAAEPAAPEPVAAAEPFAEEPAMELAEPFAAAEPEAESAPAEFAAGPASPAPKKKTKKRALAQADALETWWPRQPVATRLNLVYAGQVEASEAIALMFDGSFKDAAGIGQHVQVLDVDGKAVAGDWSLGRSTRLVSFPVPRKGRYTVLVQSGLADAQGRTLSADLHGPVYIQ